MYVILVYDITLSEGGQKIWRKVFKYANIYLSHIQNSVFEGEISESNFFKLKNLLDGSIRKNEDSVIFFTSNNKTWLKKDILGYSKNDTSFF